mmetsp:Transcript_28954/g.78421  ORF Transcript_28954/g.78421 Transcript_28954/m.78421 type:complete len:272 (-) Transcript_28954:539-1354(-)|eukprot:CAMPEP_0172373496 /NCGR_PEP_ID=MMETSP1060-20121228/51868_1 /TAXON_ID=37318 /ORGANISM="Pseudo-nitzschia pungens, Strain cf. cingulata" /LENGTH=271 /DNA_ID=CAMNT_0013099847 /DNA_START=75 /DNA_END=890 /DNA_ORIENTATION=+
MTSARFNLCITLFFASILVCSGFTTSLSRTIASISTLSGPNGRQQQTYSNGRKILQQQLPVVSDNYLFYSNTVDNERSSSAVSLRLASSPGDDSLSASSEDDKPAAAVPTWKRILFFYKYNKDGTLKEEEDDSVTFKQKLAKMGLSALLSYGFVSNMSYCVTVSLAWFGFSKKTGLSPLAPGQWKGFLAVYAGFYVFNNFIRPMRLAVSIGVTPYFDKAVETIQRKTKLSKSVSIGIVVFLANICGTTSLMSLGIYIASLFAGVPIFPPKA